MPLAGITIKATSPARHLEKLKARLSGSTVVGQVFVVSERIISDHGYFRAGITLMNGGFLEVSEDFFPG